VIIRCIDFETTGIPTEADKHAIVEVGICDLEIHDGTAETFVDAPRDMLCNPGRPIPHEAMAVHHITDAMVADASGDAASFIGSADYFAAHNADYENQFFKVPGPLICTWKVALRLWSDAPSHSLQFLRYHLGLSTHELFAMPPHRAGPDAYVCALLMERIVQEKRATLDDMVRWSNGPGLLPRCPIGKHYGKKWEEVPTDYLEWIVFKAADMDPTVKANAKHHLLKRGQAR
jgi:exodeoxyribonuclease X